MKTQAETGAMLGLGSGCAFILFFMFAVQKIDPELSRMEAWRSRAENLFWGIHPLDPVLATSLVVAASISLFLGISSLTQPLLDRANRTLRTTIPLLLTLGLLAGVSAVALLVS